MSVAIQNEEIVPVAVPHELPEQSLIPSLDELLTRDPDQFVSKYTDIAAINLACAIGLPKADDHNFPKYLALLEKMATAVRLRTEKSWRLFDLKPAQFNHSRNVFRVLTMEHVLRMQFGVKYDPLVWEITQSGKLWKSDDSTQVFIHGILNEKRIGTCSSLPTFSIAVGRRLGYPLKLVRVPKHTLFRWDDGEESFNIQHTMCGSEVFLDERFHEWPIKWDADMFASNERTKVWLHSMTPRQEVSKFLCNRAILLRDIGRNQGALDMLVAAERFDPSNPACADIVWDIERKMSGKVCGSLDGPRQLFRSMQITGTSTTGLTSMPVKIEGDYSLNVLNPFRNRANDPKHFCVVIRRVVDPPVEIKTINFHT